MYNKNQIVADLRKQPYASYSYSYPHKSSYGRLEPAVSLKDLWQHERRDSLFLYVHVPFCEMRCGFCNLFTRAGGDELYDRYIDALARQMQVLSQCTQAGDVATRKVSRLALGGGTPTVLDVRQLSRIFEGLELNFSALPHKIETSIETSPKTATLDRLSFLKGLGVQRISIGVQSFLEQEVHSIGRPQVNTDVVTALERIKALKFPTLNIDLIYGQPNQTVSSWMQSIQQAASYEPEELFLYPLYIRPETGLAGKQNTNETNFYRSCYREARDYLLGLGYEQFSMRCFRLKRTRTPVSAGESDGSGVDYCCQEDGMLGLGCGARSYTTHLHYSSRFAVARAKVNSIIDEWISQSDSDFSETRWGVWVSEEERQRRYVIQSLLNRSGFNVQRFEELFSVSPFDVIPELGLLRDSGFMEWTSTGWVLSQEGLELSDAIGPFLYSESASAAMARFSEMLST